MTQCGSISNLSLFLVIVIFGAALGGCRGMTSEKPPIHLNPNMDTQPKYTAQRESGFFADGAAMRTPPEGTVARGQLRENLALFTGKDEHGSYVTSIPISMNEADRQRGTERYIIYCTPCHGVSGDGKGNIMKYNYPIPPTSFHEERINELADGALYEVIADGIRNMPSYKEQIPVEDRWRIVSHVRELQRIGPPAHADSTSTQQ